MVDTCVCCGAPVPEGRQICWICEHADYPKADEPVRQSPAPDQASRKSRRSIKMFFKRKEWENGKGGLEMAACYKCDACGKVIADRYQEKMKEFYISYFADDGMLIPWNHTRKVKVDLCDDCYHGLNEIARRKSNESL